MYTVYLIHQYQKIGRPDSDAHRAELGRPPRKPGSKYQSGHYIGKAKNLAARINEHRTNQGASYMAAVNRAGVEWCVARTWKFDTWAEAGEYERQLKRQKHADRFCPECNRHLLVKEKRK